MCFVVALGKYVHLPILTEWLTIEEFVAFDTALCNVRHRSDFLAIVALNHAVIERSFFEASTYPLILPLFEWASCKRLNLSLKRIQLTNQGLTSWSSNEEMHVSWLSTVGNSILHVEMERISDNSELCCKIFAVLENIDSISLKFCDEAPCIMSSIVSEQLRTIIISDCNSVSNDDVRSLLRRQPLLESLTITNCYYVTPESLRTLRRNLTALDFANYDSNRTFKATELIPYCCPGLQSIRSWGVCDTFAQHLITVGGSSLTALDITDSKWVSDGAVAALISACRYLTDVNVSFSMHVGDITMNAIASHLPLLRRLNVTGLTGLNNEPLSRLFARCTKLEDVCLYLNQLVDDTALRHLTKCPALTKVTLVQVKISASVLEAIMSHCPRLSSVSMSSSVPQEANRLNGLHSCGAQLTTLSVSGYYYVTDGTLTRALTHCPSITDISVSSCPEISGSSIVAVMDLCTQLRRLACNNNPQIEVSNSLVDRMVQRQRHSLRSLHVNGVRLCTPEAMRLILHLPRLRVLEMKGSLVKSLAPFAREHRPGLVLRDSQ